jgi:predicted dienelactone hydrolase
MWLRLLKGIAALVAIGVVSIGGLFAYLSVERSSDTALPAPTGAFAVGRAIYDWRDDTTVEALAPNPETKREILAWIWYPAVARPSAATEDYIPAPMLAAAGPPAFPFSFVYRDHSKVHGHSLRDAVMPSQSFPVVILRGGASAAVTNYTTLAEDLASHGYVVVGIDAPYRTGVLAFPDGRTIRRTDRNNVELYEGDEAERVAGKLLTAWTSDMTFALDRLAELDASDPAGKFTGRLDMTRVGAFGHSFGGAQAAQFCHDDARCRAAIDIDGRLFGSVIQDGMSKPFMFLISMTGTGVPSDPETGRIAAGIGSLYSRLRPSTRWGIFVRGANHFLYSDDGAVAASRLVLGALRRLGMLKIDGRRQLAVTTYCVHTFFDAYLKEAGASPPNIASPLYPELDISTGTLAFPR